MNKMMARKKCTKREFLSLEAHLCSNIDIFSKDPVPCNNISEDENADLCKKRSRVISMQNLSQISGV